MNRIITSIIAALSLLPALGLSAQTSDLSSNERVIGYTVTDDIDLEGVMVGEAGTYTMGAYMPASSLTDYKGCKVVGIRVAVALDLGRTSIVLNSPVNGEIQELHTQKQRLYQGWNNVYFNGYEYEITGEEDLFYGFDYTESDDMVSNEVGGLCCVGSDTTDAFVLCMYGDYYTVTGAGMLCIQMIVDVSNMPANKMNFGLFDYGFKYKEVGEDLEIYTQVNNVGLDDVSSYRVACQLDENEPEYTTVELETPLTYGASDVFDHYYSLSDVPVGGHKVTVYIDQINGVDYPDGLEKCKSAKFALYQESLPRNAAYMEIYADQGNVNTMLLDEALDYAKSDLGDTMITVKNFRPGNRLASDDGAYLHDWYAYTYPCFSVNRSHFPGETYVSYDVNDYLQYGMPTLISAILDELVMQDAQTPSFASLELSGTMSEDRMMDIKVSSTLLDEVASIYGDLTLTLMVVEDNVKNLQRNSSGKDVLYTHSDVLREFISSPGEVVISGDNKEFSTTISAPLSADYDESNVRIVGLLTENGEITEDTLYDFDVVNAAQCSLSVTGINHVEVESSEEPVYYNLQGLRVNNPEKGIYIKVQGGKAVKIEN